MAKSSIKREMLRPQNLSPHISREAKAAHRLYERYSLAKPLILYNNRQELNTTGRPGT